MPKFRIQPNTDSVDINSKCLGVDVWVPGDSLSLLNMNRGLHIQIRHNGDKNTFEVANELSRLICNAPQMLQILQGILQSAPLVGLPLALEKDIQDAASMVSKLKGNKNV